MTNARTWILGMVLVAFCGLTAVALREHGYLGILSFHFTSSAGLQVIVDLVIVCLLAIAWMIDDARRNGRRAWPYVLITLALGSFGPLLYLLVGELVTRGSRQSYA